MTTKNQIDLTDKATLKALREHLAAAAAEFGVTAEIGTMSYDPTGSHCSFKMTAVAGGADENGITEKDRNEWNRNAMYLGLKPEHLGATISLGGGREATIVGVRPRARKHPITVLVKATGEKRVISEEFARLALNGQ